MSRRRSFRELFTVGTPALAILVAGFAVAYLFVEPAPPNEIEIATGDSGGAYYAFASQYRKEAARSGVALNLRKTSGSIENLRLLRDDSSGIQIALVQGGTGDAAAPGLMSLASLYYEPVWLFHRGDRPIARLTELRGRHISIGPEGSGTRAVALRLMEDNKLINNTKISPLGGGEAAAALRRGDIDAAFFVASPRAGYVRDLLAAADIQIMSFARAGAYERRHRFLSRVTLPMGVIDMARNLPRRDVTLLAPTAALVARDDLHPALIELLLRTAGAIHRAGGLFENPGEFPSGEHLDFALNEDAARYLKSGPGFLQRFLPFWIANFLDRTKVLLLPLITLLIPLFRILPPAYRWRMRSKIIGCYRSLAELESDLRDRPPGGDLARYAAELERIDDEVSLMHLPPGYLDAVYALRLHIDLVRARIGRAEGGA